MLIFELKSIEKSFGIEEVITDFSLSLQKGERIGLIGRNGTGKTTIFKILAGLEEPDSGEININNDIEIGLLSQQPDLNQNNTIFKECLTVFAEEIRLQKRLSNLEEKISSSDSKTETDNLLKEYSKIQEKFEQSAGYSYESKIKQVAIGLGFKHEELDKTIEMLSGGEKTRVGLVKLLLEEPDLLLLDEPTNHLDIESVDRKSVV